MDQKIDRLPPHSTEAEQGVLGTLLLAPECNIPLALSFFKTGSDVFYEHRHKIIYETLARMFNRGQPIDFITLNHALKSSGDIEPIGGIAYLISLPDNVPSAGLFEYYAGLVLEQYKLRKTISACSKIIADLSTGKQAGDVESAIGDAQAHFMAETNNFDSSAFKTARPLVKDVIGMVQTAFESGGSPHGIKTGFADIDSMTGGLQPSDMIVLAARPSVGKTSLAMNIAEHVALVEGLPVGVFSLEMSAEQLMLRMLASESKVSLAKLRDGNLLRGDFDALIPASTRISKSQIVIDDSAGISIAQIRGKARQMAQSHAVKLIVVDYLQLLHSTSKKSEHSRNNEISEISSSLKMMAKELKVPVVVLSQLSREPEKVNRPPKLSDLRDSGAIEQDADVVFLLHRKETEEDNPDGEEIDLNIAKQRNGETGPVKLFFRKKITRFESCCKISKKDFPDYDKN
jgi:replicative DNA helicase